jgi:DNA polymerase-3 subunit alpha
VVSLNDNLKLNSGHIIEVAQNGVKPVYELTASSGKKIQATANHRFLTAEGWKELSELKSGERIALARTWPTNKLGQLKIAEYKIVTLAHVLSEGNTCHPCGFYLYSNSYKEVQEFVTSLEMFSNTKATVKLRNRLGKDEYEVYASRINTKEKSEAVEWIKRYCCLDYKKATEKFIPPFVFRLSSQQLAIFLGKLWNGDGCIDKKRGVIYYATSSEKMACQIQNLLLRFSIFAKLHHKQFKYRDTFKKGWVVSLTRYDNIIKFSQSLGSHLIGKRKEDLELLLLNHKIINSQPEQHIFARGTFDTVPIAFKAEIRELCQKENLSMQKVARWAGVSERLFWHDGRKVGLQRETMQRIAEALDSARLQDLAQSDIFWDKVKAIERQGEKMTYDLSIAQNHNFVANGFIVHNSHSVAYGLIAYNTAYLKAHYPEEFMSAVLTSEKADIERISFLIDECKSMAIEVLAPEINQSFRNFSVVPGQHQIRFGLLAIKNVGSNIVDAILEERKSNGPFKDFSDFVSRINDKDFNKKSLESLAKAGVFDQMEDRAAILDNMENILAFNRDLRREKTNPQKSLFGNGLAVAAPTLNLKKSPPAKTDLKLLWEKELLGLYISSHPLHNLKNIIQSKALPIKELRDSFFSYTVRVAGVISSIKKIITKKGQPMIFMKLEDLTDKAEIVVFPSILEQKPELFQENKIVFVTGKIDQRKEEVPTLICQDIEEILEV